MPPDGIICRKNRGRAAGAARAERSNHRPSGAPADATASAPASWRTWRRFIARESIRSASRLSWNMGSHSACPVLDRTLDYERVLARAIHGWSSPHSASGGGPWIRIGRFVLPIGAVAMIEAHE